MTATPQKQKIEIGADLCAALQVLGKRVPLAPGERPTYDWTLRWLLRTHPGPSPRHEEKKTRSIDDGLKRGFGEPKRPAPSHVPKSWVGATVQVIR